MSSEDLLCSSLPLVFWSVLQLNIYTPQLWAHGPGGTTYLGSTEVHRHVGGTEKVLPTDTTLRCGVWLRCGPVFWLDTHAGFCFNAIKVCFNSINLTWNHSERLEKVNANIGQIPWQWYFFKIDNLTQRKYNSCIICSTGLAAGKIIIHTE